MFIYPQRERERKEASTDRWWIEWWMTLSRRGEEVLWTDGSRAGSRIYYGPIRSPLPSVFGLWWMDGAKMQKSHGRTFFYFFSFWTRHREILKVFRMCFIVSFHDTAVPPSSSSSPTPLLMLLTGSSRVHARLQGLCTVYIFLLFLLKFFAISFKRRNREILFGKNNVRILFARIYSSVWSIQMVAAGQRWPFGFELAVSNPSLSSHQGVVASVGRKKGPGFPPIGFKVTGRRILLRRLENFAEFVYNNNNNNARRS